MAQRNEHALMGLASELGEICSHYQKVHQGHPIVVNDVIDELGDMLWFAAELCDVLRIGMDEVAARNIEKLMARYPEGFAAERSLNRDRISGADYHRTGMTIKCYADADECAERDPTGWCGRFDRMCEEVHVDVLKEDGEE